MAATKSVTGAIKCVSMNNKQRIVRPMLICLNIDELHYYTFIISINRGDGSCNILKELFGRICLRSKVEDMSQKGINESKAVAKHISCDCSFEFDGRECNSRQKCNNDKC